MEASNSYLQRQATVNGSYESASRSTAADRGVLRRDVVLSGQKSWVRVIKKSGQAYVRMWLERGEWGREIRTSYCRDHGGGTPSMILII